MSNHSQKRKWNTKRALLVIINILLSLTLIVLAGAAVFGSRLKNKLNYRDEHPTLSSQEAENIKQEELETIDPSLDGEITDGVTVPPMTVKPIQKVDGVTNILLIGQDRRPGESTQRSDSMILVTFNKNTKKITMTSIMRDQYVNIPGYGNNKLCHAYQYGGMPLLNQTLYNHFGVKVDGNIEVDFSGFEGIIDMVGGVEVDLTSKEASHLNKVWGWNLKKGTNLLSGRKALAYARLRAIDSDYDRAQRQQRVLIALFEKYKDQNLFQILSLTERLLELVTTDIPKNQITGYVMELFPLFTGAKVESFRIPMDGTFTGGYIKVSKTHKLWCQYNIDFEANRNALEKILVG